VRTSAEAKGVRLTCLLDPFVGQITGDPDRLQQVVWNLLSNSIKFTPGGGSVEVRLERTDFQARITIRDTGLGINPEFLPYVFDRFRQADASSTKVHGGLGLGLSIVRHLIEMHGGTVAAASQGEGRGSSFTIMIPLLQEITFPEPAAESGPKRADARPAMIRARRGGYLAPFSPCPRRLHNGRREQFHVQCIEAQAPQLGETFHSANVSLEEIGPEALGTDQNIHRLRA